jgi:ubiquinol-cytochrome c reductase cytochrome c1 subunit
MMRILAAFAAALGLAAAVCGPVLASGGRDLRLEPAPINRLDAESLQRGARTFVNYCLNCHSARYMRYNRLKDIGIDQRLVEENLMFATDKVGNTMTVAMTPADGKAWFGTPPPDLTVEARVRGADWLYNYFLSFYQDDSAPSGWNNLVFPNVAMPHVLYRLGGINRLATTGYDSHEAAEAAATAAKGLVSVEPAKGGKYAVSALAVDTPGTLDSVQYRILVAYLVNYLEYMAEPVKNERIHIGLVVMLYLVVLFVFAYLLKREYWKDVH